MAYIEIKNLTKDYGKGRGIFDLSLEVDKGEVYGFVGINGAGKTTTIRHMMGFIRPGSGQVTINGLDALRNSAELKRHIAYIPGEINFPGDVTGTEFLKNQIGLSENGSWHDAEVLIHQLQLDTNLKVRSMSKGMKQKTAIVAAFASNADIIIMDEPSTGLDPLMRDIFLDLITNQKQKGKTIFMSSHIYQELEEVCDRTAVLQDGRIIDVIDMNDIRHNKNKTFRLEFKSNQEFESFLTYDYTIPRIKAEDLQLFIQIHDSDINKLVETLSHFDLVYFKEIKHTFENYVTDIFKETNT
ncbi:MAG: ABC transporter ATP-binding protein [Erysipelothrix sp.]|nr:ABC transporter ATP-binding protein [Erysipelothrix sp.]